MTSAAKWKTHTSTTIFATKFEDIIKKYAANNELRSQKIEDYLIEEAKKAGVIKSRIDHT
jgi:hypothetical protein